MCGTRIHKFDGSSVFLKIQEFLLSTLLVLCPPLQVILPFSTSGKAWPGSPSLRGDVQLIDRQPPVHGPVLGYHQGIKEVGQDPVDALSKIRHEVIQLESGRIRL